MVGAVVEVVVALVPLLRVRCFAEEDPEDGSDVDAYVVDVATGAAAAATVVEVSRRRLDMGAVVVTLAVKYLVGIVVVLVVVVIAGAAADAGGDFLRAGILES